MSDALQLSAAQVEAMNEKDAEAALSAWVKAKRRELPEALAASKSKVHARLAKKALYNLKSVGVEVATPAPVAETVKPVETAPEEFPCVLSSVLGSGERAVFFVRPQRGAGLEVYQGIIHDERGVLQLEGGTAKRATYRKRIEELQSDPSLKVLLVPWERMKLELGRALTLNERSMTKPTDETSDILRRLGIVAEDPDFAVPSPVTGDEALVSAAAELHQEPELKQWLPSEDVIAELGKRIQDLEVSVATLKDAATFEQAAVRARALAAEWLTPVRRRLYARRLWTMAELFEKSARGAAAQKARAEARHLFHAPSGSHFLDAMFVEVVNQRRAHFEDAKKHLDDKGARLAMPAPR